MTTKQNCNTFDDFETWKQAHSTPNRFVMGEYNSNRFRGNVKALEPLPVVKSAANAQLDTHADSPLTCWILNHPRRVSGLPKKNAITTADR